jgi:RND family efflux transporter MFP subunit
LTESRILVNRTCRTAYLCVVFLLSAVVPVSAQGPPPAKVAVADASIETVRETVTLIGTVEAFQSATVASVADGRVLNLAARTGKKLAKGDALAVLDTTQKDISRSRASAQAAAGRVRLSQAEADLALARKLLPSQAVSSDEVATRERTVAESQNQLAEAEAEVATLSYLIDQATIRAPFAGILTEELVQAGEWVAVGGGVAKLVDLSTVRVKVWVPEHIVGGLTRGDSATVHTEAGTAHGTIHAIIPDGDPNSRNFPVEIRVANGDGHLFAGMLARVDFGIGKPEDVLTVPSDAVVTRGNASHIWKVVNGVAVNVPVTMGRRSGDRVEVTPQGDLTAGDTVVTRGNERVRPGQAVTVMP